MGDLPEHLEPEHEARTFDFELTKVDQMFEDSKPNYYNFSDEVFEVGCFLPECNEKFKTRLKLLKYCSPQHYTAGLDLIVRLMTVGKR